MALRAKTREASQAAKDREILFLVYWNEEEGVSIYPEHELEEVEGDRNVGDICLVKFGKNTTKSYSGKVAFFGKKSDVILKEKMYLNGTYTPFQFGLEADMDSHNNERNEGKPKRKRKQKSEKRRQKIRRMERKRSPRISQLRRKKRKHHCSWSGASSSTDTDNDLSSDNDEEPCKKKKEEKDNEQLKHQCERLKDEKQKLLEDLQQLKDEKLLHISKLQLQHEQEEMLMDKTRFDNEVYTTAVEQVYDAKEDEINEQHEREPLYKPLQFSENETEDDHDVLTTKKSTSSNCKELKVLKDSVIDLKDSVVYVKKVQESINHRLNTIEKSLHDHVLSTQPHSMPPKNIFATIVIPTRANGQHVKKTTFCNLTNRPDNQCPSQKAASVSPSQRTEPSPSSTPSSSETTLTNTLLKQILSDKEENPLPAIDKTSLLTPQEVIEKYPKLMTPANLPTLAVRLCKEAYFGKKIMALCTVRGTGSFHALPGEELSKLKMLLLQQSHPRLIGSRLEFENTWKTCIEAIGQACKSLRKPSPFKSQQNN